MDTNDFARYQAQRERVRIVAAAQALLLARGLGAVEVEAVALALRIPVAAVERQFPAGQPALVEAALADHLAGLHQQLLTQRENCSSAVEELLAMRRLLQEQISATPSLFMQELPAQYPALHRRLGHERATFTLDYLAANLRRGIGEGLYQPDLPVAEQAREWLRRLDAVVQAAGSAPELTESCYAQLTDFLAQLTTPTGAYVVRRLQEACPFY